MMEEVGRGVFTRMDQMHHLLSGFKSLFSAQGMLDIEEARRTCGGAGYQSNSGFTTLFASISPVPTYEGENTVMMG
jgi:acyl-CoA oxidase